MACPDESTREYPQDPQRGSGPFSLSFVSFGASRCRVAAQFTSLLAGPKSTLVFDFYLPDGSQLSYSGPLAAEAVLRQAGSTTHSRLAAEISSRDPLQIRLELRLETPGHYPLQLLLKDPSDGAILLANRHWVEVRPRLDQSYQMVTVDQVREQLHDLCAEQNLLLGELEFSNDEIVTALQHALEEFNTSYYPKTSYTTVGFPSPGALVRGTIGYLLRGRALQYARNQLSYRAGGIAVTDQDKTQAYTALSNALISEWRTFVMNTKLGTNMEQCWGIIGSDGFV